MNSATERGEFIRVSEPETGIWVLRLNRPEVMNAWHGPMRAELAQVMNEIATSDARVVIFAVMKSHFLLVKMFEAWQA